MGFIEELRSRAKYVVGPVIGVCAVVYFAYHVIHGDRGLLALWQLKQKVSNLRAQLTSTEAERDQLERRVKLLNPESLDPDMLNERARLMLNYGEDGEMVIFEKQKKQKQD